MLQPNDEIGSYRIVRLLGEGGMGIVYLAEHTTLGRRVALKVLRSEYGEVPQLVSRFITEAKSVNRIGHPNIIDITDFGRSSEGFHYFVMEYLSGENLAQRLKRDFGWPLERALGLGVQVANALAACHTAGVVHRDLKPDNIFLV